jgi:hypothetical protein
VIRPLVWQVIWVDARGHGLGTCGHRHVTVDEATMCPFEPADSPVVSAGLVRQVRDPAYVTPQLEYAAGLARLRRQLELPL